MKITPFLVISTATTAIVVALMVIAIPRFSPFGSAQSNEITIVDVATTTAVVPEVTKPSQPVVSKPKPAPVPKETIPVVVPPPVSTSTESHTVGTTTLAVQSIPLLVGGTVRAGQSVAISYLQITNVGKEGALLKGFWVKQNGSASTTSIIGLSTVDDNGGSRGSVGGVEGFTPFQNGLAFAPTEAFFASGQMRLFTIKAVMTSAISAYIGTQLMIDVELIETTAKVKGKFPIRGTTWTIVQ